VRLVGGVQIVSVRVDWMVESVGVVGSRKVDCVVCQVGCAWTMVKRGPKYGMAVEEPDPSRADLGGGG
jgi:hypothetical protein